MTDPVSPPYSADLRPGASPSEARCAGDWVLRAVAQLDRRLAAQVFPGAGELVIDATAVTAMDTSGAWLLHRTIRALEARGRAVRVQGLRPEFDALLRLVVARAPAARAPDAGPDVLARIGRRGWDNLLGAFGLLTFLGEAAVGLARALAQPGRIRWRSILYNVQTAGFEALPITGLLSFLLGIGLGVGVSRMVARPAAGEAAAPPGLPAEHH